MLTLEHLDQHTWLVVRISGEGLTLLGWDGGVALNELGHHATSGLETHGQRRDVEQEKILDLGGALARKDGSLDGGTIRDGLVWVDGAVWLLAIEELLDHGLHLGDTRGAADKHDLVDVALVDARVTEALLDRAHGVAEVVHIELLEAGTRQGAGEVDVIEEGVNLDSGLSGRRERALGALALGAETADSTLVASEVLATVLTLEVLHAEVDNAVVEVLTAKVRVASSGLHLEDTIIEGAATHVIDEDVLLASAFLVKTVGNSSSGWLVDDTKHVHTRDGASVLGGLALRVVEVGRHRHDRVVDLAAEIGLSGLLHLEEDHGRDFLGVEFLRLALRGDNDHRLVRLASLDLEWPELDVRLHGWVL